MKKIAKILSVLAVMAVCMIAYITPAQAEQIPQLPTGLYLTQNVSGTCTLCASAMMIRASLYQHGNSSWSSVTENGLRSTAWVENVGLKWSFSQKVGSTTVQVGHRNVSGITEAALLELLHQHPEGIVLYCGKVPHAVYLTGYENGVFYCADTVKGISGRQIPLQSSWLGSFYSAQAEILKNVTAYWFVEDYLVDGQSLACRCSGAYAGTYVSTADSVQLRIRSGHGTTYAVLGTIPYGAEVTVLRASGQGASDWAHIRYNGITGYASMGYLQQLGRKGTVTTNDLRIRSGAGTGYSVVGFLQKNDRVEILETRQVGVMTWGRIQKGWISLDYVQLDGFNGSVNTDVLRIRANAGTNHAVTGYYYQGDPVEILETKQVGTTNWGRTVRGWISLDYVLPEKRTGRINTQVLRIRAGAGTGYAVVGYYYQDATVTILETVKVGSTVWGRTDRGWISLDYVR